MSLYVHDRPVGPPTYVGREQLGRSLEDGVRRGRAFLLCGGPRTGRSSTIERLCEAVVLRWQRQPEATKLVPVRLDLARCAAGGPAALVRELWAGVSGAVLDAKVFGAGAPVRAPQPELSRSKNPWVALAAALEQLWEALRGTSGWCQWLLVLEHGDLLLGRQLESALKPLAELVNTKRPGQPHAVVIDAGRLFREHLLEPRTPWRVLRLLLLGTLRDAEAEGLIRLGLPTIGADEVAELCAWSGKHPYILQRLLAERELAPKASLVECRKRAAADLQALYNQIWAVFDLERGVTYRGAYAAPEHALMQYLIDCPSPVTVAQAERDLGIKPLREYAELLEYLGVAEKVLAGNQTVLRATSQDFNRWYSARIRR